MKIKHVTRALAGASFLVLPASAFANGLEVNPPVGALAIVRSINGIEQRPDIAGLETWGAPDNQMVFLHDPQSGVVIAGFPFDPSGAPLGEGAEAIPEGLSRLVEEVFAKSVPIPKDMGPEIEDTLSGLTPDARKAAIDDLIARLRPVTREEDFQKVSEDWLADLRFQPSDVAPQEAAPASASSDDLGIPAQSADPEPKEISQPAPPSLLEAMQASFGVVLGSDQAPQMVMFADPASVVCGKAIDYMAPRIEAGELSIKILPVSIVGPDGAGLLAGLLAAEDKLAAARAMGTEEAPYARASTLQPEAMEGLAQNEALGQAARIPRLPFFAYATTEGPIYIDGVPGPEQIEKILAR